MITQFDMSRKLFRSAASMSGHSLETLKRLNTCKFTKNYLKFLTNENAPFLIENIFKIQIAEISYNSHFKNTMFSNRFYEAKFIR